MSWNPLRPVLQHLSYLVFVVFVHGLPAFYDDKYDGTDAEGKCNERLHRGQLIVEQRPRHREQGVGDLLPIGDEQAYAAAPQDGKEEDQVDAAQAACGQLAHDAAVQLALVLAAQGICLQQQVSYLSVFAVHIVSVNKVRKWFRPRCRVILMEPSLMLVTAAISLTLISSR